MSLEKKAIGCHNCTSACCRRGVTMPLDQKGLEFLKKAGTVMSPAGIHSATYLFYTLESDCGHLGIASDGKSVCTQHTNPNRPRICGEFKAGSADCNEIRRIRGLPFEYVEDNWDWD